MNAKNIAVLTTIGLVAVSALVFAYPAMATSLAGPQSNNILQGSQQQKQLDRIHLTVGQSISLSSVSGGYRQIGNPSVNGTATGSLSLKVTGALTGGYALAVSGGSVTLGGTSYAITTGSAELGPYGARMVGQGQAGTSQFLFASRALGKFGSTGYGVLRIDLSNGANEFAVRLLVKISS